MRALATVYVIIMSTVVKARKELGPVGKYHIENLQPVCTNYLYGIIIDFIKLLIYNII